jgi:hypothetical protein
VTADEARQLFSAAYEAQLAADEQLAFDAALEQAPELLAEYSAFCATLDAVRTSTQPVPDILGGVQRRLRNASAGRYYGDRFAERSGIRRLQPWLMLGAVALLLGLTWLGFRLVQVVQLSP